MYQNVSLQQQVVPLNNLKQTLKALPDQKHLRNLAPNERKRVQEDKKKIKGEIKKNRWREYGDNGHF